MDWDDHEWRHDDPDPREFAKWVSYEAFAAATLAQAQIDKLQRRLRSGDLVAAASRISWTVDGKVWRRGVTTVDPRWWTGLMGNTRAVFEEGDATIVVPDPTGIGNVAVHFFNLSFEPQAAYDAVPKLRLTHPLHAALNLHPRPVEQITDSSPAVVSAPHIAEDYRISAAAYRGLPPEPPASSAKAPTVPVSPAVLNAWWEFYKTVREPHLRKDEDMVAFFQQCLPDKGVTRARLRELRGPQAQGPKPSPAK